MSVRGGGGVVDNEGVKDGPKAEENTHCAVCESFFMHLAVDESPVVGALAHVRLRYGGSDHICATRSLCASEWFSCR